MKTNFFYTIFFLFAISYGAKSQLQANPVAQNIVYLEAGGIGGYGSLNYERIIPIKAKLKIGLRIGVSTYNLTDYTADFNPDLILPIAVNLLYGNNHKMIVGLGQTISNIIQANPENWEPERKTNFHANFTIGYRYQKAQGGIMISCSYTPIIEFYNVYRHWAGLMIGYAF